MTIALLTRAAVAVVRTALAPIRRALTVPVVRTTDANGITLSPEAREEMKCARDAAIAALAAQGVPDGARVRALNALVAIDDALRVLTIALDPSSAPAATAGDAREVSHA